MYHAERMVVKFKYIDRALGYCPAHKPDYHSSGNFSESRIPKVSEADLDACLNCTKPDCGRCKGPNKGKPGPASKYDPDRLIELIKAGYNRAQIAEAFEVSEVSVHKWMQKLKRGER